jgi:hypothetical protein
MLLLYQPWTYRLFAMWHGHIETAPTELTGSLNTTNLVVLIAVNLHALLLTYRVAPARSTTFRCLTSMCHMFCPTRSQVPEYPDVGWLGSCVAAYQIQLLIALIILGYIFRWLACALILRYPVANPTACTRSVVTINTALAL